MFISVPNGATSVLYGTIQLGRKSSAQYLHFTDHYIIFALLCTAFGLGAVWAFSNAWKRYLMHDKETDSG